MMARRNKSLLLLAGTIATLGVIVVLASSLLSGEPTTITKDRVEASLKNTLQRGAIDSASLGETMRQIGGLCQVSKVIGDYKFLAEYQPSILMALENNASCLGNADSIIEKLGEYEKIHCIKLKISKSALKTELLKFNLSTVEEYSGRITYYSFHAQDDAYVVENEKDTLKGAFCHLERTFDVNPNLCLTLAFPRKTSSGECKNIDFVFQDRMFGNGQIKMRFNNGSVSFASIENIKSLLKL